VLGEGCLLGRTVGGCPLSSVHNIVISFVEGSHVWGAENAPITKLNLWERFCP
jgi:hypothetical protein